MIGNKNFKIDRSKLCSCVSEFCMANYVQFIVCKVLDVNIKISMSLTNDCYLGDFIKSSGWTFGLCIEELEFESQ